MKTVTDLLVVFWHAAFRGAMYVQAMVVQVHVYAYMIYMRMSLIVDMCIMLPQLQIPNRRSEVPCPKPQVLGLWTQGARYPIPKAQVSGPSSQALVPGSRFQR